MKTLSTSVLLAMSALTATSAIGQTRPVTKPAATTTATRTTASKPAAAVSAKPKPVANAAKPAAPKAVAPVAVETEPTAQAATAPAPAPVVAPAATAGYEFGKGSTAVNLGVGFGLSYGYYGGSLKSIPALSMAVDRGFIEGVGPGVIGIGGMVGYKSTRYDYAGTKYKATWSNFYVGARGTYHYNVFDVPKLDTYAGISLGVRVESYKDTYYQEYLGSSYGNSYGGAGLYSGIFAGGRYMFTDKIGAFAEAGYDMSFLKFGLTARF